MKKARLRCGAVAVLGAVCLSAGSIAGMTTQIAHREQNVPVVSYGVSVLSAKTDMAVSAPVGNEIVLSEEVFCRGLNLSRVESITVVSLPDSSVGELLLGSSRVAQGETIAREHLSYLSFSAADEDLTRASFTFTANGTATPMVCNLYFLEGANYTPTVSMASGLSLSCSTYRDLKAYGVLSGYDPDGDGLLFEIVSYPQNGSVKLTDKTTGSYVYTPQKGYVGSDSFSYVVRDKYGNYSASATVNLKVTVSGSAVTYADMQDSKAYNAALALTEAGVMSGRQVGNRYYFDPEKSVSRVEFLVMAMNAAGITEVPQRSATVFADDGEIPESMKGYVAAAYEMGYITGSLSSGVLSFLPNREITRAEAAVMLGNIVGLSEVAVTPTFADGSEIPVWARDAIYSLHFVGIMGAEEGCISATAQITRAQSAEMLAAVMEYVN